MQPTEKSNYWTEKLEEEQQFLSEASYIIYKEEDTGMIYARNGSTGNIDYSGTDAATVIQNAIDALTDGGKIYIKKGEYNISSSVDIDNKHNLTIYGEKGSILIPQIEDIATISISNSQHINIYMLEINQLDVWRDFSSERGNFNIAIRIVNHSSNVTIDNIKVLGRKFGVATMSVSENSYDYDSTCSFITIRNCKFMGKDDYDMFTALILHGSYIYIYNNYIKSCLYERSGYGVDDPVEVSYLKGSHFIIEGNFFYGGIHNIICLRYISDVLIEGNVFFDTREDAIDGIDQDRISVIGNVFIDVDNFAFSNDNNGEYIIFSNNLILHNSYPFRSAFFKAEDTSYVVITDNLARCGKRIELKGVKNAKYLITFL